MNHNTSSRRRGLESGAEPGAEKGFSLMEVMIAMGLLGISAYLLASMTTYTKKTERSTKTGSNRDNVYFQIANRVGDPVTLARTLNGDYMSGNWEYNEELNCFQACALGAGMAGLCTSFAPSVGTGTGICFSHGGVGTQTGTAVWFPGGLVDPTTSLPLGGNVKDTAAGLEGVLRYSRDGAICRHTQPNSMCPINVEIWYNPVCPQLAGSCNQASSFIFRYKLSWTTDTSVTRESAAFREMQGEVETYRKYINGDFGVSLGSGWTEVNTFTGTGTGTGGLSNTNTQTCTTDTDLSTMTDTAMGYWIPYCG